MAPAEVPLDEPLEVALDETLDSTLDLPPGPLAVTLRKRE